MRSLGVLNREAPFHDPSARRSRSHLVKRCVSCASPSLSLSALPRLSLSLRPLSLRSLSLRSLSAPSLCALSLFELSLSDIFVWNTMAASLEVALYSRSKDCGAVLRELRENWRVICPQLFASRPRARKVSQSSPLRRPGRTGGGGSDPFAPSGLGSIRGSRKGRGPPAARPSTLAEGLSRHHHDYDYDYDYSLLPLLLSLLLLLVVVSLLL